MLARLSTILAASALLISIPDATIASAMPLLLIGFAPPAFMAFIALVIAF